MIQMKPALLGSRYQNDGIAAIALNDTQLKARGEVLEKIRSGKYAMTAHPCVTCDGVNFQVVALKDRYGLPLSAAVCESCGLVQTNPRMDQGSYAEFYDSEYRRLYVGAERVTEKFFEAQMEQGRKIARFLEKNTQMEWASSRVLEVGCGAGGIVNYFRELGAKVKGCDLGFEYLQYGVSKYGLELRHGTIDSIPETEEFDLIVYSHVFEHLLDPKAELGKISRRLTPGGMLYIEVPGIHNIRKQYRCDFLRLLQHAHVMHFTLKTLNTLLESGGFGIRTGSEYVQAIYESTSECGEGVTSDFPQVIESLRRYEKLRPVSRYLPDNLLRVIKLNVRRMVRRA